MKKRFIGLLCALLALAISPSLAKEGFIVETLITGNRELALIGQQISFHYEGKLKDGTVFDASRLVGNRLASSLVKDK